MTFLFFQELPADSQEAHQSAGIEEVEKRGYIRSSIYDPRLCTNCPRWACWQSLGESNICGALQHVQGPDGGQRATDRVVV